MRALGYAFAMEVAHLKTAGVAACALFAGFGIGKFAIGALSGNDNGRMGNGANGEWLPAQPSLIGSKVPRNPVRGSVPEVDEGALAEESAWLKKIEKASLRDLPDLLADADEIRGQSLRRHVRRLIWLKWVELDPENALAAALQQKSDHAAAGNPETMNSTLRDLFRAWALVDTEGALAAANQFEDANDSKAAFQAIARGRSEVEDPEAFLEFIKSLPESAASGDLYAAAISQMAAVDRDRAITEAIELPWTPRIASLNALFEQWAVSEPHAALEGTIPLRGIGLPIRDRAIAATLPGLAKADPALAGKTYQDIHSPSINRAQVLHEVVTALAEEDPVAAAAWLGQYGEMSHSYVASGLIGETLVNDPALAVEIYDALQTGEGNRWVKLPTINNPAAALDTIGSLPDSFGKQRLQGGLLSQWASSDFQSAALFAETLTPGGQSFGNLYRNPSDLEGAWDHAATNRSVVSDNVFNSLVGTVARADPDLAIRKFQGLPGGEFRDSAAKNLASTLARENPFKGAEFVSTLPPGEVRNDAIRTVSNRFAADDPFATSDWIANLPTGTERDLAAVELVNVVQQFDPSSAFVWAADIEDNSRRNSVLREVVRNWAKTDRAAAAAGVRNAAALPDDRKAVLLEVIRSN